METKLSHHVLFFFILVHQRSTPTPSPQIERLDDDVAWLENIYDGQDLSVNIVSAQQRSQSDYQ